MPRLTIEKRESGIWHLVNTEGVDTMSDTLEDLINETEPAIPSHLGPVGAEIIEALMFGRGPS